MTNRWSGATVDCVEPRRVPRFWSSLLDREEGPSPEEWVCLGDRNDVLPRLVVQPVCEPKHGKTRIHLDVVVISLGGSFTGERHDYDEGVVVVMADPEGHEFCLTGTSDAACVPP